MDLSFSPAEMAFREEVRDFLADSLPADLAEKVRARRELKRDDYMRWQKILHAKGWAAPDWPAEYGGTGWSIIQRYIFAQECVRAETPGLIPMSLKMCGPMLIGHGTEAQKAHYLPRILSGEDIWCQGYSEPGSGSDLASLRTMAVGDGDDYIVNGTKIWTSYAQHANMMFALVRTSTEGKQQEGISFLLIDMATPGITVKPIINLAGVHELNQVFFDDVRVPKANRVGPENGGWTVAKYLLEFERFGMGSIEINRTLEKVEALARITPAEGGTLDSDPAFAAKLSQLRTANLSLEMTEKRVMASLSSGRPPGAASSFVNVLSAEVTQRADELGVEACGYFAAPWQPEALELGANRPPVGPESAVPLLPTCLSNRMRTIAGGSSEIQRNIVAKAILGL